jgi:succinate dehydrogenase/fumarate reductase flavoprotein subunit
MDPIMWDPFRYKLGGKLLNRDGEEFTARYGSSEDGRYVTTRDVATYAIAKEVEAGRGSPHGGAFLSFQHCSEAELRSAFGPVIDRLAKNDIDLTKMPVEVAPIAHYHMGGVIADERMETEVPGLMVAGEAVGGANGANRLSGNAITEALVFGRRAGLSAAERAKKLPNHAFDPQAARVTLDLLASCTRRTDVNSAAMIAQLQTVMADDVGPFRTEVKLKRALTAIEDMTAAVGDRPIGSGGPFDLELMDWFDLRNMLMVARTVTVAALARTESRGAHQREDFPGMLPHWRLNQQVRLDADGIALTPVPIAAQAAAQ